VLLVICCFSSVAWASSFLSDEIEAALAERGDFLQGIGLEGTSLQAFEEWLEANDRQQFEARLAATGKTTGTWPHYMRGLISEDGEKAAQHYGYAMDAADAGALWLLALEFIRYEQYPWAEAALDAIEKKILGSGGTSAPLLSQMLMLMGNAMASTSPERAMFCYKWSPKFDPDQPWWAYKKGGVDFPRNVTNATPGFIAEALGVLASSWRAQVAFIAGIYRYLSVTLFIFVCTLFLVLTLKYLSSGVHHLGDALFGGASPRFRTASSIIVVLSVFILGIQPALWLIALLVYRFVNPAEKKLLIFACVILTLSPLNHYTESYLRHNLEPGSSAMLLDKAISEGYSSELHELAAAGAAEKPGDYASQLALGIIYAKKGDYQTASDAVDNAVNLAPDDQMALMYAGIVSFLNGDIPEMERRLNNSIAKYPKCVRLRYNLAQAYVSEGKLAASEMITDAAKIDATLVGNYMRINENLFDGEPPPLRQMMQPSMSPWYFWSRLSIVNPKEIFTSTAAATHRIVLFVLSALLLITLIALSVTLWSGKKPRSAKTFFVCRICGRLLCRKCRKGTMCAECYRVCLDSHNNAATMYNLQKKCQEKALMRKDISIYVLGILVPGAGRLYNDESRGGAIFTMLISSAVYAAYYCAFTFKTAYPSTTVINPLYFVSVLLLYNIIAIARQSAELSSKLKMRAKLAVNT